MTDNSGGSLIFRQALVDILRRERLVRSDAVAAALESVPREVFVPGVPLEEVYRPSEAIVTKRLEGVSVSSASAPEVVALMLEQLQVRPGDHVLEIGAGTGYNAALLAHLVGDSGRVVTIDIDEDLVQSAREHLAQTGFDNVLVVQADGALGYHAARPYDRTILTVSSSDIAPAWRMQLARPHGRLVLPLSLRGLQRSVAFTTAPDYLVSDSIRNCSFIPLRGVLASGILRVPLDPDGARVLTGGDDPLPLALEEVVEQLDGPLRPLPSGVYPSLDEMRNGLHLWLVTHQQGVFTLWGGPRVPNLFGLLEHGGGVHGTQCVMDSKSVLLLAWSDEEERVGELTLLTPPGGEALAERVQRVLLGWVAAGRPVDSALQISAYERGHAAQREPGEVVLQQRWTDFVLKWQR